MPNKTGSGMKRRKEDSVLQLMMQDKLANVNEHEYGVNFAQNLKVLNFASLIEATNNFSSENKLGEGGFGPVYKVKKEGGLHCVLFH